MSEMRSEEHKTSGCEFCNKYDFSNASEKIDLGKYAHIHLAGGSYRFPKEKQFQYCPVCGKRL